jgi:hypothetical protein
MSDIDAAFRYEFGNNGGISHLVGSRIYAVDLDQGAQMPANTYQRIDSPRKVKEHNQPSGFPLARYQVGCWSGSFAGAVALAKAVRAFMKGKVGPCIWGTGVNATDVKDCWVADERDYKSPDALLYCRQIDIRIFYKE